MSERPSPDGFWHPEINGVNEVLPATSDMAAEIRDAVRDLTNSGRDMGTIDGVAVRAQSYNEGSTSTGLLAAVRIYELDDAGEPSEVLTTYNVMQGPPLSIERFHLAPLEDLGWPSDPGYFERFWASMMQLQESRQQAREFGLLVVSQDEAEAILRTLQGMLG